ncbi:hypothetical protein E5843_07115 [Luteimonas yindakuii]|uniref:hypothetical protein n=1 Tax=Luteimonas yindakuii TaxID=2565782 RepID=UPI0010A403D8|nr:hypothetical protein [Luteimonas yindakuii]QCO67599.1 hypothetical protein E5843_07115 [Luteimonas yindakuii]
MRRILIAASLSALLVACDGTPTATSRDLNDAALQAPSAAAPAGDPALAQDLVVSTNEPFLQARMEGGVLVLTGVDIGERRLVVERSIVDGTTRTIIGRDATGSVEARVHARPCEDSMSGAAFPLSGELTVDGNGPHPGCARPAAMPAPGERGADPTGALLPAVFGGRWAPDAAACADPASIEAIVITGDAIRFHESVGRPREVRMEGDDAATVVFAYEGEGDQWESEQRLRLPEADTLEITGPEELRLQRVRCAE